MRFTVFLASSFLAGASHAQTSVQHPDFFTGYAAQSIGVTGSLQPANGVYPKRPNWVVTGVDEPAGIPDASLPLKIPGVNPLPAHCRALIEAPGKAVNHINCQQDGGAGFTFDGWDFSVNGGIYLDSTFAVTGPVVIKNSRFVYGPTFSSSGASAYHSLLNIAVAGSLLFDHNYLDANGPQTVKDGSGMPATLSAGHYPMTITYNAFLRGRARDIISTGYGKPQGDVILLHNYFEGLTYASGEAHGEITLLTWTGTMNNFISQYNTFLEPNTTFMDSTTNGMTAPFVPSLSVPAGAVLTNLIIDHNVMVSNYAKVNGAYVVKPTMGAVGATLQMATFVNVTLTNNYLDKTAADYCWYTPSAPVIQNFTSGGNVNLLTGGGANGLAINGNGLSGTASLSKGVLNVTSINRGGIGVGSQIHIGRSTVPVISRGTGTGGTGTYHVLDTTLSYPLEGFAIWADQCNTGG